MTIYRYLSPLGMLSYAWDGHLCYRLWLMDRPEAIASRSDPVRRWLDAYFAGHPPPPPPLAPAYTPFQARLRAALLGIPFAQTQTYGALAARLHSSPRAVGQALRANPLPLMIPCHRVVARSGIGGFSCGLDWKRKLLCFEQGRQGVDRG